MYTTFLSIVPFLEKTGSVTYTQQQKIIQKRTSNQYHLLRCTYITFVFFVCLNFQVSYPYSGKVPDVLIYSAYINYVYLRFLITVIVTLLYSTFPV